MTNEDRRRALDSIRRNIADHGRHIYAVDPGETPRIVYTIGGHQGPGFELIFAGGQIFGRSAVADLLNQLAGTVTTPADAAAFRADIAPFGPIRLMPVDPTWVTKLMLGAVDFYDTDAIVAFQVVPTDPEKQTIDIPNMTRPFHPDSHPVWTYLDGGWPYDISPNSVAITDLDAMLGYGISEVMRWETDEWEIFSGEPPQDKADMYKVPLSTLILSDTSLQQAVTLRVRTGLIRRHNDAGQPEPWQPWAPR